MQSNNVIYAKKSLTLTSEGLESVNDDLFLALSQDNARWVETKKKAA